uniref:Cytosolic enolase 3-like isoform X1 n=1 Tax=Rhizophora mucronata TaxID=61149 RepID=A0A2P2KRT9_RHIMU
MEITMNRTGSGVLALTAALTASSIFRQSRCLSR